MTMLTVPEEHRSETSSQSRLFVPLLLPALVLTTFLIVAPYLRMVRMSFYSRASLKLYDEGSWTLRNYLNFFTSRSLLETTGWTVSYSLAVVGISLLLAYPVAYLLVRTRSRWRSILFAIVVTPFMVSLVVSAYGWLVLLGLNGPVNWLLTSLGVIATPVKIANTPLGAAVAMSINFVPLQVLPLVSSLRNVEQDLEYASASLGASPIGTFLRVILPLSMPGILGGCSLVMLSGLTSFVAPRLVGGPSMAMLGVEIYNNMIVFLNWPQAAAIALVLTAITVFVYLFLGMLLRLRYLEREG